MLIEVFIKIFGKLLPLGWQGIISIASFGVIVVALIPIIREVKHRKRIAGTIRHQLFKEIDLLFEGSQR